MNHEPPPPYFDFSAIFAGASAAAAVATFAWAVLRDRVAERDARVKAIQGDKEAIAYVAYQIESGAWDSKLAKRRFRKDVIGALCLAYAMEGTDRAKSLVVAALLRLSDHRRHEIAAVLPQLHQHMLRYADMFSADAKFHRRVRDVEMLLEKLGIEVIAMSERGVRMPYDVNTLKELLLHTDNLFHTRVNFLLAVEALMFAGAASTWSTVDVRTGVAWFGVALTFIFFLVNWNLSKKLRWLMHTYDSAEPTGLYRAYRAQRFLPWLPSIVLFTYVLPFTALAGWILVLFA